MSSSPRISPLSLLLQLVTIALLVVLVWQGRSSEGDDEETESVADLLSEFSDEVSATRFQISTQADRLTRLLDKLQQEGLGGADAGKSAGHLHEDPHADLTTLTESDLLARLFEVTELHDEYKTDPIQRVPVETERARIEAELRTRGDAAINAIGSWFKETPNTRLQTRLLTNLVEPIDTDAAFELARNLFNDQAIVDGVRLVAARIAMVRWPEEINNGLVALLSDSEVTFRRLEQVIVFFGQNPYPPAAAGLCRIAVNAEFDRQLRRYSMAALAKYPEPAVIEALKQAASDATQADLRSEAIRSLKAIQGCDVVDFLEYLRPRLPADDPLLRLIDGIEAECAGSGEDSR